MSEAPQPDDRSILAANLNTIDLVPADYSIVTSVGGSADGPEGRWAEVLKPEHGRQLKRVGIFECEPHTINVPLKTEEVLYLIEGELSIASDDGTTVELTSGGLAVLPKDKQLTLTYKTRCRQLFATLNRDD